MIDVHCHLDLYPNPIEIAEESERLGIYTLCMTNLPSHFKAGFSHLQRFKRVRLALGLHPLYAEKHAAEINLFIESLNSTSYIGEIGLDYSKEGISTKNIQNDTFIKVLSQLEKTNKLLSLHSRKAEKEVFFYLQKYKIRYAIFHWYTGPVELIEKIVRAGYYFSVNPSMIKTVNGRHIISMIPHEHLLTETDGPFVINNGKAIKPVDVKEVLKYLSNIWGESIKEVELQIEKNFKTILDKVNK